jgi:hypothetical protein
MSIYYNIHFGYYNAKTGITTTHFIKTCLNRSNSGVKCVVCISTANLISIVAEVCLFYVNLQVDALSF